MKNEKGFTLVELVVSIAVLSILIVPFFRVFSNAAKINIRSKNEMTANRLAEHIVGEIKNNPQIFEVEDLWTTGGAIDLGELIGSQYDGFSAEIDYGEQVSLPVDSGEETEETEEDGYSGEDEMITIKFTESSNKVDKAFSFKGLYSEEGSEVFEVLNSNSNSCRIKFTSDSGHIYIWISGTGNGNNYQKIATYDRDDIIDDSSDEDYFLLKLLWDEDSSKSKRWKITVENDTDNDNDLYINVKCTHVNLDLTSNKVEYDAYIKENPNDNVEFGDFSQETVSSGESGGSGLRSLTVRVWGYDPFEGSTRVLETFSTMVRAE